MCGALRNLKSLKADAELALLLLEYYFNLVGLGLTCYIPFKNYPSNPTYNCFQFLKHV